jgi:hypothetical protein
VLDRQVEGVVERRPRIGFSPARSQSADDRERSHPDRHAARSLFDERGREISCPVPAPPVEREVGEVAEQAPP